MEREEILADVKSKTGGCFPRGELYCRKLANKNAKTRRLCEGYDVEY
ncbi:hypothetical protein [Desulfosporosinus fructosivorans]